MQVGFIATIMEHGSVDSVVTIKIRKDTHKHSVVLQFLAEPIKDRPPRATDHVQLCYKYET